MYISTLSGMLSKYNYMYVHVHVHTCNINIIYMYRTYTCHVHVSVHVHVHCTVHVREIGCTSLVTSSLNISQVRNNSNIK